jgi:hypothetical protein
MLILPRWIAFPIMVFEPLLEPATLQGREYHRRDEARASRISSPSRP